MTFHSGVNFSFPYIGGGNQFPVYWWRQPVITRSTSSSIYIRFAQHATDLVAPFVALGRRAVYY
jgi:hypothetical protein